MFCWLGCTDGTSIDAFKVEAFGTNEIPIYEDKPDADGKPVSKLDAEGKPMFQMYVVAVIRGQTYALRPIGGRHEAKLVIQTVLGNMKNEYDKSHPKSGIETASAEDVSEISKARKVLVGG